MLLAFGATMSGACATAAHPSPPARSGVPTSLAEIEEQVGGRVGVFALANASGRTLAHREGERFAMCSTFKWALAAAVLRRVDRGELSLEDSVAYAKSDLMEYAPITTAHVAEGAMSVEALVRAAVTVSDNTAANLLLARVGGPAGLTLFFRELGDEVTRLDRNEPTLNMNDPGDARDTTSPRAMVGSMRAVLCGGVLSRTSRERLLGLMRACETGRNRLRVGLPADWTAGDKTGTGEHGACNDVAIAVPPDRAPILIAAYLSDSEAAPEQCDAALAEVGRVVAAALG